MRYTRALLSRILMQTVDKSSSNYLLLLAYVCESDVRRAPTYLLCQQAASAEANGQSFPLLFIRKRTIYIVFYLCAATLDREALR